VQGQGSTFVSENGATKVSWHTRKMLGYDQPYRKHQKRNKEGKKWYSDENQGVRRAKLQEAVTKGTTTSKMFCSVDWHPKTKAGLNKRLAQCRCCFERALSDGKLDERSWAFCSKCINAAGQATFKSRCKCEKGFAKEKKLTYAGLFIFSLFSAAILIVRCPHFRRFAHFCGLLP